MYISNVLFDVVSLNANSSRDVMTTLFDTKYSVPGAANKFAAICLLHQRLQLLGL